jgi:Tol biopolymer transport system component
MPWPGDWRAEIMHARIDIGLAALLLSTLLAGCVNRPPDTTTTAISTSIPVEVADSPTATLHMSPTSSPIRPTTTPAPTSSPYPTSAVAPGRILYIRPDATGFIRNVYAMNADGSNCVPLIDYGYTSEAVWSPDGSKIALNGKYGPYLDVGTDIYVMDSDGTDFTRIFSEPDSNIYELGWSPDGEYIAFVLSPMQISSPTEPHDDIFTISADGNVRIQVTTTSLYESDFDWSPDSTQIVYSRGSGSVQPNIYIINIDSNDFEPMQLTSTGGTYPVWSPDGSQIAFVSYLPGSEVTGIYLMDADGSNIRLLAGNLIGSPLPTATWDPSTEDVDTGYFMRELSSFDPKWSPDGTQIAFRSAIYFSAGPYDRNALYVVNTDGTGLTNLSAPGDVIRSNFDWSPDGNWIAFTSRQEIPYGTETWGDIYLIHPDGTGLMRLTDTPDEAELGLSWQPDTH